MKIEKSKFPLRIIVLPFVMIITFCYSMWQLIDFWFNFIIYGGEFIALNKTRTKATIAETFDRVQEMVKNYEPKTKLPIGIIAPTIKRCREIARERGLKPIVEGVGDCVLISRIEHMRSCNFSEFINDEGMKFDSEWNQAMLHSLVTQ